MPQTTDELRQVMLDWFGSAIDDGLIDMGPPMSFLVTRGYTEDRGMIRKPTPNHCINREEYACIRYLIEEWDYDLVREGAPEWGEKT